MRIYLCLIAALQLVLAGTAHAELPKPTCAEYKSAYDAMVQGPISIDDGSVLKVVRALVENRIYLKNADRTEHATVEGLMTELAELSVEDALMWLYRAFLHLEQRIRTYGCVYEPPLVRKDMQLRMPDGYAYKCKAPAVLPNKLLK